MFIKNVKKRMLYHISICNNFSFMIFARQNRMDMLTSQMARVGVSVDAKKSGSVHVFFQAI